MESDVHWSFLFHLINFAQELKFSLCSIFMWAVSWDNNWFNICIFSNMFYFAVLNCYYSQMTELQRWAWLPIVLLTSMIFTSLQLPQCHRASLPLSEFIQAYFLVELGMHTSFQDCWNHCAKWNMLVIWWSWFQIVHLLNRYVSANSV